MALRVGDHHAAQETLCRRTLRVHHLEASLAFDFPPDGILHALETRSCEDHRSVLTACDLAAGGEHNVDMRVRGVPMLSCEPRAKSTRIRLQLHHRCTRQLRQVEPARELGRKHEAIDSASAAGRVAALVATGSSGHPGYGTGHVGCERASVVVSDLAVTVEQPGARSGAIAVRDVLEEALDFRLRVRVLVSVLDVLEESPYRRPQRSRARNSCVSDGEN
jgi:hypothetical protein